MERGDVMTVTTLTTIVVDGWGVTDGYTAVLPDGSVVKGCTWHDRSAVLHVPSVGLFDDVVFDVEDAAVVHVLNWDGVRL